MRHNGSAREEVTWLLLPQATTKPCHPSPESRVQTRRQLQLQTSTTAMAPARSRKPAKAAIAADPPPRQSDDNVQSQLQDASQSQDVNANFQKLAEVMNRQKEQVGTAAIISHCHRLNTVGMTDPTKYSPKPAESNVSRRSSSYTSNASTRLTGR